jgi:vitamin B12 transporter
MLSFSIHQKSFRLFFLLPLFVFFSNYLFAAEDKAEKKVEEVETIIVSSNVEMPVREVATSVSVLDAKTIKEMGFLTAQDLLRSLPSISITNSGGMGKSSAISIRGEEGFRTLVKIDGIDITDVTGPQSAPPIQHMMANDLARIEVLRGPQGLMYGADAGGVVLLSTAATEEGTKGRAAYEIGRYATSNMQGNLSMANSLGDIFISAGKVESDGINSRVSDTTQDLDGYENNTSHLRMGWNIHEQLRGEIVGRTTHVKNQYDQCGWPSTNDCREEFNQTNSRAALKYTYDLGEASLAYTHGNMYRDSYADQQKSLYNYQGENDRWELNGYTKWSDAIKLLYGVEKRTDEAANDFEEHGISRNQDAFYAEYQGKFFDRLFVTLGGRQDKTEDFGNFNTHRLSAAYFIPQVTTGELKLKATSGTGFRLPSLYENMTNTRYGGVELTPESSEGYDIGFEYQYNEMQMELVYFNQKIEDQITYSYTTYTYVQEVPESEAKGFELAGRLQLIDQLNLHANITKITAEDSNGNPRFRKPEFMANLGIDFTPSDIWLIGINYRTTQDRVDLGNVPLDDYELVDFRVRVQPLDNISAYIRIENLDNKKYVEANGYNTMRQATYMGIDVSF